MKLFGKKKKCSSIKTKQNKNKKQKTNKQKQTNKKKKTKKKQHKKELASVNNYIQAFAAWFYFRTLIRTRSVSWMDGWVRVLRPFNSISVISRRWKGEHERLCAMKRRLGSGRIAPPAEFEPATPWSEVGSANRSATRTLQTRIKKVYWQSGCKFQVHVVCSGDTFLMKNFDFKDKIIDLWLYSLPPLQLHSLS